MIEVENLSKRYGNKLAVDGLSFVVQPGMVTGFLGPNGAGKSTTMRMIAGLDQPTGGRVTVNGGDYRTAAAPMAELGLLLEAKAVHTGRSARNHLLALAQTNGISRKRVDEVIDIVGLREVSGSLVGVGRGRLIADTTVDEFIAQASHHAVTVRTPETARLRQLLLGPDITVTTAQPDVLKIDGLTAEHIGTIAWQHQIPIFELTVQQASLEEAFMTLTNDSVEYRSTDNTGTATTSTAAVAA